MKRMVGVIAILIGMIMCTPAIAVDGYSTLPGWSAGYRLYLDIADFDYYNDDQGKFRVFGKYKQINGNVIKFGIDGSSNSAVLFLEQEFRF
mgnify:CR=1 FL=1